MSFFFLPSFLSFFSFFLSLFLSFWLSFFFFLFFLYNVRSHDILKSLGWQDLATRRLINKGCWVYISLNNLTPNYLSELFVPVDQVHSYNLRNHDVNLSLPKPKTDYLKKSFCYDEAKLWNTLPSELRNSTSFNSFQKCLKSHDWSHL